MKTVEFKLSSNTKLEMVEILAGSFLMGSSATETEKRENETPQHKVNLKSFYLEKISHHSIAIVCRYERITANR